MYQICCPLGLQPRPCWRSLQCSLTPSRCFFKGPTFKGREDWEGGEGKVKGRGSGGRDLSHPKVSSLVPPMKEDVKCVWLLCRK